MWEAGRGNSRGRQGCQEVFWASHRPLLLSPAGATGPVLPVVVLTVTFRLSGRSGVGTAQKMLCRRLFPRPGCWKARPR